MNEFSEFLYTRRKALGLTQQNIADKLNITNKAVSKWEAGECFPETSQLVALADILECSVDELLRGRFNPEKLENSEIFAAKKSEQTPSEKSENAGMPRPLKFWQGVCIAVGVALVLMSVAALVVIGYLAGGGDGAYTLGSTVMMFCLAIAVFLFVFAGVSYGVTDRVEEVKKKSARRCALGMAVGVAVIIFSVAILMLVTFLLGDNEKSAMIGFGVMISWLAIGVFVVIVSGIGVSRFNLPKEEREKPWSGIIMLTATIIFLVCGFVWDAWHPAWVVFPVGGLLCSIVEIVIHSLRKK